MKRSLKKKNINAPKYDSNQKPILDINGIKNILKHRYPFLFVDKITYLDDSQVVGIKNVSSNEPFFEGHFPGNPDGGLMSTKPYISGSSYILKMSNYKKSEWCNVWDALFWRFLDNQRDFFSKNPRMRMLVSTYDKMDKSKRDILSKTAKNYLQNLK